MPVEPTVRGALAAHPLAQAFAAEVLGVHRRYATEVVAAFGLCPFLREVDAAFGEFIVLLDRAPDVLSVCEVAAASSRSVVHLVYPCVEMAPTVFERFGAAVGDALRRTRPDPPVLAVFHPQ